jgi:MFS family permease
MRRIMMKSATSHFFFLTYFATLLYSFHYFFVTYINSSYLSQFIGDQNIGTLYTVSSIVTLIIFFNIAHVLRRFGNYRLMILILVIEILSLLGLALFKNSSLIIIAFLLHHAVNPLIIVSLDIFIEHYSKAESVGKIRGGMITVMGVAAIISPVVVGNIIGLENFQTVYLISALFTVAMFAVVYKNFKNYRDSQYLTTKGIDILHRFLGDKNIKDIFISGIILQFFFSWIIIYVPIYMFQYLGFSWPQIGLAISISLLPFVLFEIPLGQLADKRIGEKEILLTGFFIMICSMLIIGQVTVASLPLWIALLTLARSGASFVEIGSDTYFFKQINEKNDELVSFWRMTHPIGYLLGAIAGSVSLILLPFQYIFFVLGGILMVGLIYGARIKDTL